jgi:PAS domain S-box-containing protein
MQDKHKTKEQLIIELHELRKRVAELEGDKAESKRAAEALRESEERYRTIMNQAADAIFVHDETGRILDVNRKACQSLDCAREELLSKSIGDIDPEAIQTGKHGLWGKILAGEQFTFESHQIRKDGSAFPVEVTLGSVRLPVGHAIIGIVRNITERKRAEEALRESEERFRRFADEVSSEGIIVHDQGLILDVNAKFAAMYGYEHSELIGMDHFMTIAPSHRELMRSRIGNEDQETYEVVALRKDGSSFPIEVRVTSIPFQGKMVRAASVRDLTEQKRAEEALISANQRLADIIEFLPDATFVIDNQKKIIAWNRAMEEMTGVSKKEMLGQGDYAYTIPFYGERRRQLLDFVDEESEELASKYENLRKVGNVLYSETYVPCIYGGKGAHVFAAGVPLFDIHGNRTGAIESIRDITERKQSEEEVMRLLRKNQLILDTAGEGILGLDLAGKITFANPEALELLGYAEEELIGKDLHLTIHHSFPDGTHYPKTECPMWLSIRDGKSKRVQDEALWKKDGTSFPSAYSSTPIIENGQAAGAVITFRDISARKKIEEDLRRANKYLENILDNSPDAIGIVDKSGKFAKWNRMAEELYGYTFEEMRGMSSFELYADKEQLERMLMRLRQEGSVKKWEMLMKKGNGSVVPFEISIGLLKDSENGILGSVSVARDLSERKIAEEKRLRLEERLQRAEKMEALGTLAGGVAHDLNNVLGVVVGYSEMLLSDFNDSESVKSDATEILKAGQRAAGIVQDLLTLTRRGVQSRKVLNLNRIIMDSQKTPEFTNVLSYHSNIEIKTDLEPDLLNLSGSSIHLGKSFMNLISNAAEAMPNGGTLTVKSANVYLDKPISGYDEVREGDYVVLSISDTGDGIPASDLKRIFEPFYTKKVMGRSGTGLGLAVVWGTVKDHHGYVNVESEEEEGTTFTLYFPVTREEISAEQVSVPVAEYMGNGESILIVDDVKQQRELAERMLTKLNYKVTTVSSGEEAVEYLKQNAVDLLVLDMIMDPGMDGLDTYRKILEVHPHQKAIIVSGFSETERVSKAKALGAGAYVKKPYVIAKLGLAVRKEINRPE